MYKAKLALAAFATLLLFGTLAHASIVYNNGGPNQQNGNEMTEWIQTEDFILSGAQTITDIHFWDIETAPGYSGSISWWITGDLGGTPDFGNILGSGLTSAVTHSLTANGCTVLGFFCEYSNDFNISGIALQGGTVYHLALHNGDVTNNARSEFYWETTDSNGTPTGLECDLTTGACYSSWSDNFQEHAFYLTGGSSVPEPGTLLLLGSGLAGVAGMLHRKMFS